MTSHTMKHQARQEFDAWAETYDESFLHAWLFQPSYRMFLEELYGWFGHHAAEFHLLDIGCGTGQFDAMVAGAFPRARVTGMDYAPAMCRVAERNAHKLQVADRTRYAAGDSEHLPFADRTFDVITCSNSFHHYPRQAEVVRDMFRVLKPGGRLMLIDGFRDNIVGWVVFDVIITKVEKEVFHAPWHHIHRYFADAGFQQIRRRKFNFWFPLLLTVGSKPA